MLTTPLSESDMAMAADFLSVMANEKRLLILDIVSKDEVSVASLALMVDLSQSALSQHLAKLRGARLVQTRRDGQTIYYRCDSEEVRTVLHCIYAIFAVIAPTVSPIEQSALQTAHDVIVE